MHILAKPLAPFSTSYNRAVEFIKEVETVDSYPSPRRSCTPPPVHVLQVGLNAAQQHTGMRQLLGGVAHVGPSGPPRRLVKAQLHSTHALYTVNGKHASRTAAEDCGVQCGGARHGTSTHEQAGASHPPPTHTAGIQGPCCNTTCDAATPTHNWLAECLPHPPRASSW